MKVNISYFIIQKCELNIKQILWQLINSAEVSEMKKKTQLIKTGIIPHAWKAQVLRLEFWTKV